MKVAIVGTRGLFISTTVLSRLAPGDVTEIVSGGADGIDACAATFARERCLELTEFLPDYNKHVKIAPLIRNTLIASHCEMMLAFWDGKSRGTRDAVKKAQDLGRNVHVWVPVNTGWQFQELVV